jgi:peptidoglycan-associated lipoprotein
MKLIKFTNLLVLGLVLTVAASGCKKKPVGVTPLPGAKAGAVPDAGSGAAMRTTPTPSDTGLTGTEKTGYASNPADLHAGWPENREILKSDTVFFDFDSSVVKASEKPKVMAVAGYLKANAANAVKIEGNCDERGTEEYNRALGERRALAVREELIRLGIEPTRVDTISFGKDNPSNDQGHDESAWRKNRRDDFVVLTPPGK